MPLKVVIARGYGLSTCNGVTLQDITMYLYTVMMVVAINLLHCRQHHAISTSTIEINDAEGTQLRFWSWLCGQATGDLFTRTGLVLHTLSEGIPWMLPGKYQFYEAHVALKGRPGTDVAWKPPLWPAQHEERSLSRALVRCNRTRNAHGLHGSCLATPSRRRHVSSHGQLDIPH